MFVLLRQENEHIFKANCHAHICHNTAKQLVDGLGPISDISGLVLKIYAHFSSSAVRREKYKEICESEADKNPDEDIIFEEVKRHVITRWSSLKPAIDRIVRRWAQLKTYFLICYQQKKKSRNGADKEVDAIYETMFENEDRTLIAMHFLSLTMGFFQKPIKQMQRVDSCIIDAYPLMSELRQRLSSLCEDKKYGAAVCSLLKIQNKDDQAEIEVALKFGTDCAIRYLNYWFKFDDAEGILKRQIYENFSLIYTVQSPNSHRNRAVLLPTVAEIQQVSLRFNLDINFDNLVEEQRAMVTSIRQSVNIDELQSMSVAERWRRILALEPNCKEMLKVMSFILSLPLSSATAERTFSQMQFKYRNERNSLSLGMLKSELVIKHNLEHMSSEQFQKLIANDQRFLDNIADSDKYDKSSNTDVNNTAALNMLSTRERAELRKCI